MEFRRLNLGAISFSNDTLQEITEATIEEYNNPYGDSRKGLLIIIERRTKTM